jgi:hypothetical protein
MCETNSLYYVMHYVLIPKQVKDFRPAGRPDLAGSSAGFPPNALRAAG